MTRHMKTGLIPVALLFIFLSAHAQSPTFNQNSSRSNNTRAYNQNSARSNHPKMLSSGFDFQLTPQYGINMKGNQTDSLLFRSNGPGFKMDAGYSFGNFGIGFSSGFISAKTDKTKINEFLASNGIPPDQMLINTGSQQNMYVLLGPAASFGNKIHAGVHVKGGLFINNSGFVNIKRQGAINSVYRNEPSSKSIYPGFAAGLNLNYHVSDMFTIGFGTDFLNTKTEVVNYDIRRGGAVEGIKLSKNISNIMAGINIRYNIKSPRDIASGQSTGKQLGKPKYEDITSREAGSGLAAGKTNAQFNPKEITIDKRYRPGRPVYGNITDKENCGPVTIKKTFGDGSTEEMTFACPDDAAQYNQRTGDFSERPVWTSSNPNKTFATPNVFEQRGTVHRDIAARNVLVGKVVLTPPGGGNGIVTNKTVRGGGLTMNESQSSTRTTPNSSFGTLVRLAAREAGSGLATGKKYEPVFIEGQNPVCNPCLVTVNNPLYQRPGMEGTNPMYENKARINNQDVSDLNPGIEGLTVSLADISTEAIVATTQTEQNGDFFFANVPDGIYSLQISGSLLTKKGYDFYMKSKSEMEGDVTWSGETVQLIISGNEDRNAPTQRAGISTSRSNLRTKTITIINADTDGDGSFDSFTTIGSFSDGTTRDITNEVTANRVNKVDAFTIKQKALTISSSPGGYNPPSTRLSLTGITITENGDKLKAMATFSDGSSWDISSAVEVKGWDYKVKQYSITIGDMDDDGYGDAVARITKSRSNIQNNRLITGQEEEEPLGVVKTKTKSNQSNDRMSGNTDNIQENLIWSPRSNTTLYGLVVADLDGDGKAEATVNTSRSNIKNQRVMVADVDGDGIAEAIINTSRSNIKNLAVSTGDLDGDGKADIIAGNSLLGGALPGGNVLSAAMIPGDPIPGLDVKLKKKNGSTEKQITPDENGRIRVIGPDMEPDTYTMTVTSNFYIYDKTIVVLSADPGYEELQQNKGDVKVTASQNTQSLRTSKDVGTIKWMAPASTQTAINTSHSNIKNLVASLDDLEQMLNNDNSGNKAINTSHSNIKNLRAASGELYQILDILETIDKPVAMQTLQNKMAAMNMQFLALQQSLNEAGRQYTTVSNVLKTKHDTVKNSIGNIR